MARSVAARISTPMCRCWPASRNTSASCSNHLKIRSEMGFGERDGWPLTSSLPSHRHCPRVFVAWDFNAQISPAGSPSMSSPQHEPTMEEILASIRKIISEDTPEVAAPSAEAPKPDLAPVADAEPDIEVLELTQEIVETPEPITMSEPFQPADEPVAAKPDDVVFETPQAVAKPEAAHGEGGIFSDQTRKAMD